MAKIELNVMKRTQANAQKNHPFQQVKEWLIK